MKNHKCLKHDKLDGWDTIIAVVVFLLNISSTLIGASTPGYIFFLLIRLLATTFLLGLAIFTKKINRELLWLLLMVAVFTFSTYLNNGFLINCISNITDTLFVVLFLVVFIGTNMSKALFVFDIWKWMMFFLILIDFFSIICFPQGLFINEFGEIHWFLGYKTQRMYYMLPMCFFFMFKPLMKKNRMDVLSLGVISFSIVVTILCKATTAMVTLLFCLTCSLFIIALTNRTVQNKKKETRILKLLHYKFFLPLIIIFTAIITLIQWDKFIAVISRALGKSLTLTNRTDLWRAAAAMILKKPILGYGYLTSKQYISYVLFTNAHCTLLTILVSGGMVGFICFLLFVYSSFNGIDCSRRSLIVSVFVYSLFVLGVASSVYLFTPFCLVAFYCLKFCKSANQKQRIDFRWRMNSEN